MTININDSPDCRECLFGLTALHRRIAQNLAFHSRTLQKTRIKEVRTDVKSKGKL
jgi:hypothetical protein